MSSSSHPSGTSSALRCRCRAARLHACERTLEATRTDGCAIDRQYLSAHSIQIVRRRAKCDGVKRATRSHRAAGCARSCCIGMPRRVAQACCRIARRQGLPLTVVVSPEGRDMVQVRTLDARLQCDAWLSHVECWVSSMLHMRIVCCMCVLYVAYAYCMSHMRIVCCTLHLQKAEMRCRRCPMTRQCPGILSLR